jgi:MoaA/NifB/PqqE/SkfB family radical SAM enzyme
MTANELTQDEADNLLKIAKKRINNITYIFPSPGMLLQIPIQSIDSKDEFLLDVRSGRIELKKGTCQIRVATVHILARIDLAGGLHRNPDGKEIPCPHIHLYREGYNDQWAYPLPKEFTKPDDLWQTLNDFFGYCNIVDRPYIETESIL